ncbi:MAG TPA: hypothetical protein P5274_00135, partial [Candidatus Paceibacterota bacterium]|nr:hypothetical protein [Candidatus Paceibacterota bacterium]
MIKTSKFRGAVLVVFDKDFNPSHLLRGEFGTIVADKIFKKHIEDLGCEFVELEALVGTGSVYEAENLLEEFPNLLFDDGSRVSKSVNYRGYELWWVHYNSFFQYFCIPYVKYVNLLEFLRSFSVIYLYRVPYKSLFYCYLKAYEKKVQLFDGARSKPLPFGVFLQIFLTFICLPVLVVRRCRLLLFTSDKFNGSRNEDFRMGFIYDELRNRNIPFVEF